MTHLGDLLWPIDQVDQALAALVEARGLADAGAADASRRPLDPPVGAEEIRGARTTAGAERLLEVSDLDTLRRLLDSAPSQLLLTVVRGRSALLLLAE